MIRSFVAQVVSQLFFIISPPYCVSCKKFLAQRVPLCMSCEQGLERVVSVEVPLTATKSMKVFAISGYKDVIRTLILAKHSGQRVASKQLGQLIARLATCPWHAIDYSIPVPLHWSRYASRGFNQAEIMAQELTRAYGIPVSYAVSRIHKTAYQARLSRAERKQNVTGAFTVDPKLAQLYQGKHILLVDDLMTTSVTLQELARQLMQYKPLSITAVVAARVT